MYRVTKCTSGIYAVKIDDICYEAENIEELVVNGEPVLLCEELSEAAGIFGVKEEDIQVIND